MSTSYFQGSLAPEPPRRGTRSWTPRWPWWLQSNLRTRLFGGHPCGFLPLSLPIPAPGTESSVAPTAEPASLGDRTMGQLLTMKTFWMVPDPVQRRGKVTGSVSIKSFTCLQSPLSFLLWLPCFWASACHVGEGHMCCMWTPTHPLAHPIFCWESHSKAHLQTTDPSYYLGIRLSFLIVLLEE